MQTDKFSLGSGCPKSQTLFLGHCLSEHSWKRNLLRSPLKSRVSQRHSRASDPQPEAKMTCSVCKQGPFSWMFAKSSRPDAHLGKTTLRRLVRASLKTVCAVHIPHFAGRKARVNLLSRRLHGRRPHVQLRQAKPLRFLAIGWKQATHDSKHDQVICLDPTATAQGQVKT